MCSGKSGHEHSAGAVEGAPLAPVLLQALITLIGSMGQRHGCWHPCCVLNKVPEAPLCIFIKKVSVPQQKAGGGMTKLLLSDMLRHEIKRSATFLN